MWGSRSVFCGGFSKQLVEIIKKKPPKATFVDFLSCGIFPTALAPADVIVPEARTPIFVMGKIRRKFEAEFKRQLIAEIEAGHMTTSQAARDHQLSRSLVERWRMQYRNNALVDRPSPRERQLEAENEKLKAKIGDLVMQMDHLKKLQAWVQRRKNADTSVITAKNLDQFRKPVK
jgi:transposase-like protein